MSEISVLILVIALVGFPIMLVIASLNYKIGLIADSLAALANASRSLVDSADRLAYFEAPILTAAVGDVANVIETTTQPIVNITRN